MPESKKKNLEPVPATPEFPPPEDQRVLVTHLKSLEGQVGEHVIAALQIPNIVAAISMVYPAPQGGQNIVSIPLQSELWDAIRELLQQAEAEAPKDKPCVGFHCYTKYHDERDQADADKTENGAEKREGEES